MRMSGTATAVVGTADCSANPAARPRRWAHGPFAIWWTGCVLVLVPGGTLDGTAPLAACNGDPCARVSDGSCPRINYDSERRPKYSLCIWPTPQAFGAPNAATSRFALYCPASIADAMRPSIALGHALGSVEGRFDVMASNRAIAGRQGCRSRIATDWS